MKQMNMHLVLVFLLLSYCCSSFCFPSRPLNERSTDLAWEAWLLVDDQNQNRQQNPDAPIRSRITPKSVFISPTFSPESLPSCAEGYRSDGNGKCMQIIKFDENAHLEFILEKLNEKFGALEYDYDGDSKEEMPTPGPFQVNIPLGGEKFGNMDSDADIAIVIAPTNAHVDPERDKKVDVKKNEAPEIDVIPEREDLPETTTVEQKETTTEIPTTTEILSTITEQIEEKTEPSSTETTTVQDETTTEVQQQALFFLQTNNDGKQEAQNLDLQIDNMEESSNKKPTIQHEENVNKPSLEDLMYADSIGTDSETSSVKSAQKLRSTPQPETDGGFVRFPEEPANVQRKKTPTVEEIEMLIRDLIHKKGPAEVNPGDGHIFRHGVQPMSTQHVSDLGLDPDIRHKLHANHGGVDHHVFNHRNRDKWNFQQPTFRDQGGYNPIVLKFANRSHNVRQASREMFHQRHHPESVYREVPEDLSYIFGLKARPHLSHKR